MAEFSDVLVVGCKTKQVKTLPNFLARVIQMGKVTDKGVW